MRRLLGLFVLVIIFAALLVLSRSRASWQHYVVSGDAGSLLYAASFDGGPESSSGDGFNGEWNQYAGRLSTAIEDGQMRVSIGEADSGAYSIAAPYFGDFDLRVAAEAIDGPVDNGYGVVFRLQNKDNTSFDDDNYYLFLISSDGWYQVSRVVDGQPQVLSDWIESSAIRQGLNAVNDLRVIARDTQFHFYINEENIPLCLSTGDTPIGQAIYNAETGECSGGEVALVLTDSAIPNGQIGVTAQATSDAGVVAAFDNLLVYAPEAS